MSEAFKKVQRQREKPEDNEILVSASGSVNQKFRYAAKTLNRKAPDDEHKFLFDHIIIKATGKAISKAVMLVEEIKYKLGDLH